MAATQAVPPLVPHPAYPVEVRVDLRPDASRWLWVVKWLLVIPHLLVLALLWLAFLVLSLVALVAILVTGRYPRAIFDFNVGVLRWTWRVAYYGYGVLGTDRYPPFTLHEATDYPAHLQVAYPDHLSRGLVLVKWWLLALPHYIVVGLLAGTGTWWVRTWEDQWRFVWGGGLVGILVLVAAVMLLFTGRYPGSVYDLLLGLHRWVLRVCAYAALMTDEYPPFRLDMGPDEPAPPRTEGSAVAVAPVPRPADSTEPAIPPRVQRQGWTGGRVVGAVFGSLSIVVSLALIPAGFAMAVGDHVLRDDAGYLTTTERAVRSDGYAVALNSVRVDSSPASVDLPGRLVGEVRLHVTPADSHRVVFVGIGRSADVERYLQGVSRTVLDRDATENREVSGGPPPGPPEQAGIWAARSVGSGSLDLVWTPRVGEWSVVLMNADASAGVAATASVGAQLPWLGAAGTAVLVLGALLLVAGAAALVLSVHAARQPDPQAA